MGLKVQKQVKQPVKSKQVAKATAKPQPKQSITETAARPIAVESKRDWEAENDAHILMTAEAIKQDSRRLLRAQAAAKKQADEALKVAKL